MCGRRSWRALTVTGDDVIRVFDAQVAGHKTI
jgi:hypothetical protein